MCADILCILGRNNTELLAVKYIYKYDICITYINFLNIKA